jgi:hypothetical protein
MQTAGLFYLLISISDSRIAMMNKNNNLDYQQRRSNAKTPQALETTRADSAST